MFKIANFYIIGFYRNSEFNQDFDIVIFNGYY